MTILYLLLAAAFGAVAALSVVTFLRRQRQLRDHDARPVSLAPLLARPTGEARAPRAPMPAPELVDSALLELLDARSPQVEAELGDVLRERFGRPCGGVAFLSRAVVPRLDVMERDGRVLTYGYPGRLFFHPRHEDLARAAGWTPGEGVEVVDEEGGGRRAIYGVRP